MYKASHSAVSRTVLPTIQQKRRTVYTSPLATETAPRTKEERVMMTALKPDEPIFASDLHRKLLPKKKRNNCTLTPPSTPSSPLVEQQIEFLHNSWKAFRETPAGEVDTKVVTYHVNSEVSDRDFQPFNIDRFLAEKLLKELDIDPKFASF